jgi:hypothetical protein
MGRLRRFRHNRSIIWTYLNRPVAGSSVTAAAAGKADGTWAVRRPFGGGDNGLAGNFADMLRHVGTT